MSEVVAALVYCPFPDRETARSIAARLLEDGLIACANILPAIESLYEWEGECAAASEVAVLLKTTSHRLEALVDRLGDEHPYDTPAIIGWRCDAAHPETLQWLVKAVG
ncbi:divalent-cation tolerance protein CutA [Qipengyuania nanhaisediminis]|uniref:divalent-cation tolerance protein CutA n=1 Tax=Qipengyuania nanhaisediminis TaxID=604088 RepID=UPI0038B3C96F